MPLRKMYDLRDATASPVLLKMEISLVKPMELWSALQSGLSNDLQEEKMSPEGLKANFVVGLNYEPTYTDHLL